MRLLLVLLLLLMMLLLIVGFREAWLLGRESAGSGLLGRDGREWGGSLRRG